MKENTEFVTTITNDPMTNGDVQTLLRNARTSSLVDKSGEPRRYLSSNERNRLVAEIERRCKAENKPSGRVCDELGIPRQSYYQWKNRVYANAGHERKKTGMLETDRAVEIFECFERDLDTKQIMQRFNVAKSTVSLWRSKWLKIKQEQQTEEDAPIQIVIPKNLSTGTHQTTHNGDTPSKQPLVIIIGDSGEVQKALNNLGALFTRE